MEDKRNSVNRRNKKKFRKTDDNLSNQEIDEAKDFKLNDRKKNKINYSNYSRFLKSSTALKRQESYEHNYSPTDLKSFSSHMRELRRRLAVCILIYIISCIAIYMYIDNIYSIVIQPFFDVQCHIDNLIGKSEIYKFVTEFSRSKINLIFSKLGEGFSMHMRITAIGGLCISMPFFIIQVYLFCFPAISHNYRKISKFLILLAIILFFAGVYLGYKFILPMILRFFIEYEVVNIPEYIALQANLTQYLSFMLSLCLICGCIFLFPIVCFLLHLLNIGILFKMIKFRKYAILGIVIVASVITPPDVISQCILSLIMLLVYEITILSIKIYDIKAS